MAVSLSHSFVSPNGCAPLDLFEVPTFVNSKGQLVADLLVPLHANDGVYSLQIAAGTSRQVWISVDTACLREGVHNGEVRVEPASIVVPATVQVAALPVSLDDSLHVSGWDYTDGSFLYQVTRDNQGGIASLLLTTASTVHGPQSA
ncbi:MAG: hypothetical protein R2832_17300 [Rhodothermales bacterium]